MLKNLIKPPVVILIALLIPSLNINAQENKNEVKNQLNPGLNIPDQKVSELDGSYSIITVEDGKPTELSIKFNQGKIVAVLIDGRLIPEENWKQYEELISEYISYIEPEEHKKYRYQDWYDLEYDLRKDLKNMEQQIRELEINKRIKRFYDEEMREWVEELEMEINESEALKDLDRYFENLIKDLEKFMKERKEYINEKEKEETIKKG